LKSANPSWVTVDSRVIFFVLIVSKFVPETSLYIKSIAKGNSGEVKKLSYERLHNCSCYLYLRSTSALNWRPGTAHATFKIGSIDIIKIKNPSNTWLADVYLGGPSMC
jgi:hypothetical protein